MNTLSGPVRSFYLQNRKKFREGVLQSGEAEKFFRFYSRLLEWMLGIRLIDEFQSVLKGEDQKEVYRRSFKPGRVRLLNRLLINRLTLALIRGGRSVRYQRGLSAGEVLKNRFETLFFNQDVRNNWFLTQFFDGSFHEPDAFPPVYQPEGFRKIRDRLNRIEVITGTVEEMAHTHPLIRVNGWNLSNILEWMKDDDIRRTLDAILPVSAPDARLITRTTLSPLRRLETILPGRFLYLDQESVTASARERNFFYRELAVYRVLP
jgi:S-adenosylmethionine:diacylglycerol 3-amino-3-carboxypropyl transferase